MSLNQKVQKAIYSRSNQKAKLTGTRLQRGGRNVR